MNIRRLFIWGSSSLVGHLVLFELFVAVPSAIAMSIANYMEGDLSASWALHVAGGAVVLGVVLAVPFWFFVTMPIVRRRGGL
jgi:hypothetical protein